MEQTLRTFVLFIGYGRSGHSLVGSLLDAHKNAVVAHELRAVDLILAGESFDSLCQKIIENSEYYAAAKTGRFQSEGGKAFSSDSYLYAVPGGYQGCHEQLQVIGDKSGGWTTRMLERKPKLLRKILNRSRLPVKWIHVVRNPYDMLATSTKRAKLKSVPMGKVKTFGARCRVNEGLIQSVGEESVHTFKHENLIENPELELTRLCDFLELTASDDFVEACSSIVYKKPHRSRKEVKWSAGVKKKLQKFINRFGFLSGYSFEG